LAPDGPLAGVARRVALVVLVSNPGADEPAALRSLVAAGVQDVLAGATPPDTVARALRLAVERQRRELALHAAHATDLATGLPTHAQLLEHMTHLLALREREPAPMALIVLQVDCPARPAVSPTAEAGQVLRRKVAVRLRAALRASDVVASIGIDRFAVLLAWIDAADAGPRVAAKLAASLRQPFKLAGATCRVAVRMGLAAYPGHGRDAETLLARAVNQAASAATVGPTGRATAHTHGDAPAANDD
jgi:diguanylate cyclase (GGDEF)-like protein